MYSLPPRLVMICPVFFLFYSADIHTYIHTHTRTHKHTYGADKRPTEAFDYFGMSNHHTESHL